MCSCMRWKAHPLRPQTKEKQDFLHIGNSLTTACSSLHLESSSPSLRSFCKCKINSDSVFPLINHLSMFNQTQSFLLCSHFLISLVSKWLSGFLFLMNPYCLPLQILPGKFLHKVWHNTLCHKHCLTFERPDSQAAAATRSEDFRHQQVLRHCKCCAS